MAQLTLFFKDKLIETFQLDEEPVTLGRDESNTFVIDSLAVAPEQLAISMEDEHYIIENFSEQFPCYLNGELVMKTILHHEDTINLKKHKLIFSETTINNLELQPISQTYELKKKSDEANLIELDPIDKRSSQTFTANLQIISGSDIGRVIPLTRAVTEVSIGKNRSAPAIIVKRNNGFYISRLIDSVQITIDGHELRSDQQLNDGELIKVDEYQFCYFTEQL